ncbi:MAG: outer membrane beta-barrel protein [Candidatus Coatesbacteria bacterium]|nr:MAG: outer membrane beta-barrel protein [Candidatus Coatesbacteria bacterium]
MRGVAIAIAAAALTFGLAGSAAADRDLRHFGELGLGIAWPDASDFSDDYRLGFSGSLGYGTRLGRSDEFFAYGRLAYDQFRSRDKALRDDTYLANFTANARYYFGRVAKYESGYVGLGPGVYWDENGTAYFGGNISVGGDFPVGNDWAITADVSQHLVDSEAMGAFLTIRLGAAYWFL